MYPAVVGGPKSLLRLFEDFTGIVQTFGHQQQKLRTRKQFDLILKISSYEINLTAAVYD